MIGRSEDAQFCLPHDRFFSRHHCILEIAPPQAFLRDLGSTNGTFVNEAGTVTNGFGEDIATAGRVLKHGLWSLHAALADGAPDSIDRRIVAG